MISSEQAERKRFELWYNTHWDVEMITGQDDIDAAWEIWKAALSEISAQPARQGSVPEEVIKAAAEKFLQWKLPADFCPDGGVSFDRAYEYDSPHWPVGTNILTAEQAEQMFMECLAPIEPQPEGDGWIECSERLPDLTGWYLVTLADPDDIGWSTCVSWAAFWNGDDFEECDPVDDGQPVTHWMPFPQPPKEGE